MVGDDRSNTTIQRKNEYPVRTTVEFRLMKGSEVLLAPQYGNKWTVSIEVLTSAITPYHEWKKFIGELTDKYIKLAPGANVRFHWAKEWQDLTVGGERIIEYNKNRAFKDQIKQWHECINEIAKNQGIDPNHNRDLFSNDLFDVLFY